MRPRRSSPWHYRGLVYALAAWALAPCALAAQGLAQEGALFLLVPIGARAVGMGQAVVASPLSSEGIWWNPAALARLTKKELSVNHSQTVAATGDALDVVIPAGRAGVVAVAAYLFNTGEQQATDQFGQTGTIYPRSVVLATSYAATFGSRVAAGLTYKYIQDRLDCSGACGGVATYQASTSAADIGIQVIPDRAKRLTLGAVLQNTGFRLQINDAPQADPLPTRLHIGASYQLPQIERAVPDGELHMSSEVVDRPTFGNPSVRFGGEFAYKKQYFLRGGFSSGSGDATGAAVGLGVQRGGIAFDFARAFGGFSADAGQPPTYVTLRFRF